MSDWKTYPMLRLAIFLSAGIFFAGQCDLEGEHLPLLLLLAVGGLLGVLVRLPVYRNRFVFGIGVACFLFLAGWGLTVHKRSTVQVEWESGRRSYTGRVLDTPQEKRRSVQCLLEVAGKQVLAYLAADSLAKTVEIGEELLLFTRIQPPSAGNDSLGFDYARYLLHQGISGTAYVPSGCWKKTGRPLDRRWKQQALRARERLMDQYRIWGIGEEQIPTFSALTVGYKGGLDRETREAYSVAGIAHVLALSGMHIVCIWWVLSGVLRPLSVRWRLRWLKWLLTTVLLWGFAFVVGLEASVVRAVVMCMLMELSGLVGARSLSMNNLGTAAFFMLMYNPYYLFDVGFQLSFVAVASILLFYPLVSTVCLGWNWLWQKVGGVLCISVAAQLGTAPLVMYYFSIFSVHFLLANLGAALLVYPIIYGCLLMVVLAPLPAVQAWVVWLLNRLVGCLDGLAVWTGSLPYATFSFSRWEPLEVLLCYLLLAAGLVYVRTHRYRWLLGGLAVFACLLVLHLCLVCGLDEKSFS